MVKFFPVPIHPVLARELRQPKRLQKFFDSLPESSRHQIDREVREVKKEETRLRRAQHAAEYLMEAMEAELGPFDFDTLRADLEGRLETMLGRTPLRLTRRVAFFAAREA